MHKKSIAGLILAAGSSSRMGSPKQLMLLNETTILEHVVKNLEGSSIDRIFCVIGESAPLIRPYLERYQIDIIFNPDYKDGLSSSINCGINHIVKNGFDTVLIALGDQPLIKSAYFNNLITTFNKNEEKIIATDYSGKFGVPIVVPKTYFYDLLLLKGEKGAKEFLNSRLPDVISLKTDTLFDVDTKEDYDALIKKYNKT